MRCYTFMWKSCMKLSRSDKMINIVSYFLMIGNHLKLIDDRQSFSFLLAPFCHHLPRLLYELQSVTRIACQHPKTVDKFLALLMASPFLQTIGFLHFIFNTLMGFSFSIH